MPLSPQGKRRKEITLYINADRRDKMDRLIDKQQLRLPNGADIIPQDIRDIIYASLDSVLSMNEPD